MWKSFMKKQNEEREDRPGLDLIRCKRRSSKAAWKQVHKTLKSTFTQASNPPKKTQNQTLYY